MTLRTRLTERLGIRQPVLVAPMGFVSGGVLAAAVSAAGGLGLIGGGYADPQWLERELAAADNQRVSWPSSGPSGSATAFAT
jgi:nitronate monooxygenase